MRLAAQAKMGYYPVQAGTLELVCKALKFKDKSKAMILDPCCGAGMALRDIGAFLQVPRENLFGVELDEKRAELAAEHATIAQGSFFNTRIVPVRSFSMAWVNPPYENEIRQAGEHTTKPLEYSFLEYVFRYVDMGGLICLHMPADRVDESICRAFHQICFDPVRLVLPENLRPYRETVLIGQRRNVPENHVWNTAIRVVHEMPDGYLLPSGTRLKAFEKMAPTDTEIASNLPNAAFWKVFDKAVKREKLQPLLPLGAGHLGLTLASGCLDGLLCPADCEKHVVRGIAWKEPVLAKEETTENDEGKVTETKTYRENMKLKIRAITADGTLYEMG